MIKTILMLLGLGTIFAIGTACFGPSSKADRKSPAYPSTNSPSSTK